MGTQEVKDFFEKFEELTSLANDGDGMSAHEKLIALSNCLLGSKKHLYNHIRATMQEAGTLEGEEGYRDCYVQIKQRLMKFLENKKNSSAFVPNTRTSRRVT